MSEVVHRVSKQRRRSVHTPNFPSSDWIINPDLSAVENVPQQYWKIEGDTVSEMSQAEKDAVDASLLPAAKDRKHQQIKGRSVQLMAEALADLDPGDNVGQFQSSLNSALRGKSQAAKVLKDQIDSASTLSELDSIIDDR